MIPQLVIPPIARVLRIFPIPRAVTIQDAERTKSYTLLKYVTAQVPWNVMMDP